MIVLGSYVYGALLYPSDLWILITGVVYLFFIPFMNMILPLYAICNIVDQSWGTRDNVSLLLLLDKVYNILFSTYY